MPHLAAKPNQLGKLVAGHADARSSQCRRDGAGPEAGENRHGRFRATTGLSRRSSMSWCFSRWQQFGSWRGQIAAKLIEVHVSTFVEINAEPDVTYLCWKWWSQGRYFIHVEY